jgi:hypothetical protein
MQEFLDWLSPIWKPHPGQLAFLEAKAKTKVLACGRRWGKPTPAPSKSSANSLTINHAANSSSPPPKPKRR